MISPVAIIQVIQTIQAPNQNNQVSILTASVKRWRAADLKWKSWEDGKLVFHTASGNTHVVNPLAASILRTLADQPTGPAEVSQRIAAEAQLENDDELLQSVEKLLANLDELGLIEPISP